MNSDTYTLFKGPGEEFEEYLKKIKSYSDIKTEDTELTIKDKIVTLSTCTGNESTRFVVQGKESMPRMTEVVRMREVLTVMLHR